MADLIGRDLGRYHILEQLGEGGMATVYKAYDTRLERDVAVKIIRRGAFPPEQLERILKRFEREAKALARLSHPNIVKVHDFGDFEGAPFLVMEYLPGGTLKGKMGRPIPWQEAVNFLIPVARALDYAHHNGILHRDVKPSNILITATGEPMLTDFGIARILDIEETHTLTGTGVGIGTPEYMSPEQGIGHGVDARADIYSLGIVLYELISGRKPFTADTPMAVIIKHINEPLPPPRQFVPDLPLNVEKVLIKALAKQADNRYPQMSAFAAAMESLSGISKPDKEKTREQQATDESTYDVLQLYPDKNQNSETTQSPRVKMSLFNMLPVVSVIAIICLALAAGGVYLIWKNTIPAAPNYIVGVMSTPSNPGTLPLSLTPSLSLTQEMGSTWTVAFTSFPSLTPLPAIGSTQISPLDGMEMVFVPAGDFMIGVTQTDQNLLFSNCAACDPTSFHDAPQRSIYLDEYWIDKTVVSVAQFAKFVNDTGTITTAEKQNWSWVFNPSINSLTQLSGHDWLHPQGNLISLGEYGQHPVVHVSWNDAKNYCAWAGRRLPSEAEWEKAARGTDGRLFPWGNNLPTTQLANINAVNNTIPVGSYPDGASPYDVLDMAGNVWEWTKDYYQGNYYSTMPESNPPGPSSGTNRVLRGGSWGTFLDRELVLLSSAYRLSNPPGYSSDLLGFRCASAQ